MNDKDTLKVLQNILTDLESIAKYHRTNVRVSKALHNVYASVAAAGKEIIDKMTNDERIAGEVRQMEEREKKRRRDYVDGA